MSILKYIYMIRYAYTIYIYIYSTLPSCIPLNIIANSPPYIREGSTLEYDERSKRCVDIGKMERNVIQRMGHMGSRVFMAI